MIQPETRVAVYAGILALTPIFVAFVIYCVGSFTAADTNTANWALWSRVFAVVAWLFFSVIIAACFLDMADREFRKFEKESEE